MSWLIGIISFFVGLWLGGTIRSAAYKAQDWKIIRWNKDIFGYRPVPTGCKVLKGERILLALELDSSEIDEEGMTVE